MADEDTRQVPPRSRRGVREGYTTGTCATAASLAATRALLRQQPVSSVTVHLPAGRDATFSLARCEMLGTAVRCGVVKDAGDDPDVTHGAEIVSLVSYRDEPGIELAGGDGVGTVTRPGLGLDVGGPAINPVPRAMITQHVLAEAGDVIASRGLRVEISIPGGEKLARKTLNGRLGIVGGLSVLGTTGIVKPWSTAAWRASVLQAIDVAAANGEQHVVLSTGGRSETYMRRLLPHLSEMAFVEMGEFTGAALQRGVEVGCVRVSLAGMIGKFSKLAMGHFMTHVAGNQVDVRFLASLALDVGASADIMREMETANTARHFQEIALANDLGAVFDTLAGMVRTRSVDLVENRFVVDAYLFGFDGTLLGSAEGAPRAT